MAVIKEVQFLDDAVATDDEDIIDNTSISNNEGHFIDNTLINIPILILTYKKYQTFSIISTYFHVFQLWIKRRYHNFKQNNNLSRWHQWLLENNHGDNISYIEDMESCISQTEQCRSKYRRTDKYRCYDWRKKLFWSTNK